MSVITRFRRPLGAAAVAGALTVLPFAAGTAYATPEPGPVDVPTAEVPTADAPVPVAEGEYSYLATRAVTERAASMRLPEAIASLPVPEQYRPANLALAAQFDMALQDALATPGGCVQVVVDPRARSGNLFDYGFFAVAGEYCP